MAKCVFLALNMKTTAIRLVTNFPSYPTKLFLSDLTKKKDFYSKSSKHILEPKIKFYNILGWKRILSGHVGFTYTCRVLEWDEVSICSMSEYLRNISDNAMKQAEIPVDDASLSNLLFPYVQLSLSSNYHLTILPDWRVYPVPTVDCKLTTLRADLVKQ